MCLYTVMLSGRGTGLSYAYAQWLLILRYMLTYCDDLACLRSHTHGEHSARYPQSQYVD